MLAIQVHTNPATDCHYLPVVRAIDEIIDGLEELKRQFLAEWESTYVESDSKETFVAVESSSVPFRYADVNDGEVLSDSKCT